MKLQVLIFGAGFLSSLPACMAASFCSGQPLCCPRAGPGSRYLQLQQTNEQTLCTYGTGQNLRHCTYDTFTTTLLSSTNGCPPALQGGSTTSPYCPLRQEIRSGWNWDKCIEAGNGNGGAVRLRPCNNGNNQRLILYSGAETQIQVAGTKFCLDVGSSTPVSGTIVKIRRCLEWSIGDPPDSQRWLYDATSKYIIHLGSSLYLDVPGNGDQLDLKTNNPNSRQIWRTYE